MAASYAQPAPSALANWDESRPSQVVRLPDGRRLNFRCSGSGGPVAIMEGGWAATSMAWFKVAALEAPHRRICAYDRAGMGFSSPGPLPRDGAAVAADLEHGLKALHLRGPLILVGHSSGGLYMRAFAGRTAYKVAGVVLVDPSIAFGERRMAEIFGAGAGSLAPLEERTRRCLAASIGGRLPSTDPALVKCGGTRRPGQSEASYEVELAQLRQPSLWRTELSELEALDAATSEQATTAAPAIAHTPLIVLTAGGVNAGLPETVRRQADEAGSRLHQEIAHLSSRGSQRVVAGSSHLMMLDQPAAIASAIEEVAAARR